MDPHDLPQESSFHRTAAYVLSKPPGSCVGGRSEPRRWEWTEEETAIVKRVLAKLDKPPRNTEIPRIYVSSKELRNILSANTFERIRNKVKNIFKKRCRASTCSKN